MSEESTSGTEQFDEFEAKLEEMNEGLLEAYAAGFSLAVETFDVDPEFSTEIEDLMRNEGVAERHYYYWDGRSKPLELWLHDQFEIDGGQSDD